MSARFVLSSLHFRITAVFLLLLVLVFAGYTWWVDQELYGVKWAPGEQEWYEEIQGVESDSLAALLTPMLADSTAVAEVFATYTERLRPYDSELSLHAADGRLLFTTAERSVLSDKLIAVNAAILDSMSRDDWDYTRYPDHTDMGAYVNRLERVIPLQADGDTLSPPEGWLTNSFRPFTTYAGEFDENNRFRTTVGAAVILFYAFVVGLVLLTWVSQRVRTLSTDMARFRDGDFEHRARATGADEIGQLSRDFNRLADRLNTVIGELKQSEEYRSQLVANISHDLRTPMATLRSYVESFTLGWERLDADSRDRQLKTITSNLDNLEELIERLFELTRLDSGQAEFRPEEFSLEELAADVLDRISVKAEQRGVSLHMGVEGELPLVHADPLRMVQVLQNLIDNAVKFNRQGGHVWVDLKRVDEGVEVTVRDDGAGVSDADAPHVFERFYTADKSRTDKGKGSGLGLAIAHRIVANHGGTLTLAANGTDGGAAFRFVIPAASGD